jgi:hypothetical protein
MIKPPLNLLAYLYRRADAEFNLGIATATSFR